jgi:hypothetical protein
VVTIFGELRFHPLFLLCSFEQDINYGVLVYFCITWTQEDVLLYLGDEFYSNFLTVFISSISCSSFTTLTSWSLLEQQVQFAVSHSKAVS